MTLKTDTSKTDTSKTGAAKNGGTPDLRGLKALVFGLGALIVLGTALVIGVVVKRSIESTGKPAAAAPIAAPLLMTTPPTSHPGPAPFSIVLPGSQAAKIGGIAAAGGEVAIWVRDNGGGHVVFIDPRTGATIGTAAMAR
ncbi:MAG: hypothetical protein PHT60_11485 [Acidiphilium sp.]|nr:hypothetical protein [Acidiphilium sp.]MDD4936386.1 hypothetical protein [Acidiphilium sp.]